MELTKHEQITNELLIEHITAKLERIPHPTIRASMASQWEINKRVLEIALAALKASKAPREYQNGWPLDYSEYAQGRNECLDEIREPG
ncbi:hypothetical protein D9F79_08885 [Escherichia coli]|jgi:hypothetical protein|uniref:hypothetical protein n=1 Tax=Escherichia coli TaxID=562 RepID=UPI0006A5DF3E|nr:hypothetical protein [Escherichia coli]DAV50632.1 MAG TPA: hypothetical protein [Caudoviricetes sp.]EEW1868066.1 hypothetical protein [Escherichia coli]EHW7196793.1 hypothetical protein [Escherichia coli]BEA72155.1 hypothetical protein VEE01_13160 [Escherichia coli]HAW0175304.1 hypothetical protein [Escherichia coli]